MPHAILLNDSLDTVKRLWFDDDGGARLQRFTKEGCAEIRLTQAELALVCASCPADDSVYWSATTRVGLVEEVKIFAAPHGRSSVEDFPV